MTVVVPRPGGGKDHVSALHVQLLSLDGGEALVTLDDEAKGKGNMAMSGGGLAGVDELQTGIQGVGGLGSV